jgi:predicted Zn finger-like uncharacterized protein
MAAMVTVCPNCHARLRVPDTAVGKRIRCSKCKEAFAVPAQEEEDKVAPARAVTPQPKKAAAKSIHDDAGDVEEQPAKRKPAAEEEADEDEKPRRKDKPARRERDDGESDDEKERPRGGKQKKAKGNPLILWGAIGGGVAVLVLVGATIGLLKYFNPENESPSKEKPAGGSQSNPDEQVIKATDLTRDLAAGEKAMLQKYGGKTLTVEGSVLTVALSKSGAPVISLSGHTEKNATHLVACTFPANQADTVLKVQQGSTARIKGVVFAADTTRSVWLVMLRECAFVNAPAGGPAPGVSLDQAEIARLAKDREQQRPALEAEETQLVAALRKKRGPHEPDLELATFELPNQWSQSLAVSPNGKTIAIGGGRGGPGAADREMPIKLLDVKTLTEIKTLTSGDTPIQSLAFSADGKKLISGEMLEKTGAIRIWDIDSGKATKTINMPAWVWAVAMAPDGKCFASASGRFSNGAIDLWDVVSGEKKAALDADAKTDFRALAFSADGKLLAYGGWQGKVHVWDFVAGRRIHTLQIGAGDGREVSVDTLAFSPDGIKLVVGSDGGGNSGKPELQVWDPTKGTILKKAADPPAANGVAFSRDGKVLVVAGDSSIGQSGLFVFNAETLERTGNIKLTGSSEQTRSVQFSPGSMLGFALTKYAGLKVLDGKLLLAPGH